MNRNVVVTIGVLAIIFFAVGGFMFMNRASVNPAAVQTEMPSLTPVATATTEKASLKSFMSMTGDQKCEFSDSDNGSSGTVYLNAGKMRGDFMSKVSGKESSTHMINNGTDIHIWMDDQKTGFKTTLDSIEQMSQMEGTTGVSQTVDINKQVNYKCESWSADPAKFTVPTEIKFQDISNMMKNMPRMHSGLPTATGSSMSQTNIEACSACNNLEGTAQAQCRRALKCN